MADADRQQAGGRDWSGASSDDLLGPAAPRGRIHDDEHLEGEVLRHRTRIAAEATRAKSKRVRERKARDAKRAAREEPGADGAGEAQDAAPAETRGAGRREARAVKAREVKAREVKARSGPARSRKGPEGSPRAKSRGEDSGAKGATKDDPALPVAGPRSSASRSPAETPSPRNRGGGSGAGGRGARKQRRGKPKDANARARRRREAQARARSVDPDELSSEELVRLYYESGARRLRAAVVERFLADVGDMARILGSRMPRSVDVEDLCNAGYFGLLRSLDTYDPGKGRSFGSYMRQRVRGSMIDELRAMDWLPRLMRSRLAQRAQAVRTLTQEHGREPSETEIAARLGLSLDAYRRAYPASGSVQRTSLFANTELDLEQIENAIVGIGGSGREAHDDAHPLTGLYHQELIERVRDLLSDTEWRLVELHYLQGRKLRDVAEELQLSPARICQIHHAVMRRLKERLRGEAFSI